MGSAVSELSWQVGNLLKNDPSALLTSGGISGIVTGSLPGVATGVGVAYGVSRFIGNQIAKPLFVGIAVVQGGSCFMSYEGKPSWS